MSSSDEDYQPREYLSYKEGGLGAKKRGKNFRPYNAYEKEAQEKRRAAEALMKMSKTTESKTSAKTVPTMHRGLGTETGMFRDMAIDMTSGPKTSFATSGLFNKAKGAYSARKESGIKSYFSSLLPTIKKQVVDAYRQNSKSHSIHGKELEDQIRSKTKTYEKKQKKFKSAENKLASLSPENDKYPAAEKALSLASTQVAEARNALQNLLSTNPVDSVSKMFDEVVTLGSENAEQALRDVESKVDQIVKVVLPQELEKRQKDKALAVSSIQSVVDKAREIAGL